MINPFELSRLLDKTHHLKTKKDPIAPWIIGSLSWGGGIYAQKSIGILPPPPSADAPHRALYHFIAQFAPWLLVAIIATGLALGLWAIARKRRHKATIPPHLRPITYAHWALFAFTLGLIAALSSSNRPPNSRVAPLQPRSKTSNPAQHKRRLQSHNTPATKRSPPSSTPPPMPAFRSCPTKPNRFALAR